MIASVEMSSRSLLIAVLVLVQVMLNTNWFSQATAQDASQQDDESGDSAIRYELTYAPPPVSNPLVGLVPYAEAREEAFPHSMEFDYLPLSSLVIAQDEYDWTALEKLLDEIASRGHQAVFRIYLEFPGRRDGIPQFLIDSGLKTERYEVDGQAIATPDYSDPRLVQVLTRFIEALGERYDADPRVGYITAGLLGHWGEWHTYPRENLFASKEVQNEILTAYEQAFEQTPILLRYPASSDHPTLAANVDRAFGYHDDSFAWGTLDTGRSQDDWFFLPALSDAGGTDRWKKYPIGGEIRPEAWGQVFDLNPRNARIQDFEECVKQTHASWLMDSGMFDRRQPEARQERARELVRLLGYALHIPWVTLESTDANQLKVKLAIENRGVAPFYRDWSAEFGVIGSDNKVAQVWEASSSIKGILPEREARVWNEAFDTSDLEPGEYELALRVPNPLPNGPCVRFANETQDEHVSGWLSLGRFEVSR